MYTWKSANGFMTAGNIPLTHIVVTLKTHIRKYIYIHMYTHIIADAMLIASYKINKSTKRATQEMQSKYGGEKGNQHNLIFMKST